MKPLINKSKHKKQVANKRNQKFEKEKKICIANMRLLIDYLGGEGTFDIIPANQIDNDFWMIMVNILLV